MTIQVCNRALLAIALVAIGCGSDNGLGYRVDGTWERGGVSGDHFGSYVMQLRRDGSAITGVACRLSSAYRLYVDRPVSGTYPFLSFDGSYPSPTGAFPIDLRVVDDTSIVGVGETGRLVSMDFYRTDSSAYERCRSAGPPPGEPR